MAPLTPKRAVLFDLDGTLVSANTARLYMTWQRELGRARRRDTLTSVYWFARYRLGLVDIQEVGAKAIEGLRGTSEAEFEAECAAWVERDVLPRIGVRAHRAIANAREDGAEVAILTGSSRYVAGPVARALGIEHVLATKLGVQEGVFTGTLDGPILVGAAKVGRTEAWAAERDIDLQSSTFYTDSHSDLAMLLRVSDPRVVDPDPKLWLTARRRGWPIERWRSS